MRVVPRREVCYQSARMARILTIEDDAVTAGEIVAELQMHGNQVDYVSSGSEGLQRALTGSYDVITLDRLLPDLDGLALVKRLREAGVRTPVLMISALSDVDERIRGLRAGGDDYMTKPFAPDEMAARIEVLLRRKPAQQDTVLRLADLELDLMSRTARRSGAPIELLPLEFKLLDYLMHHPGQVLTRTMIFEVQAHRGAVRWHRNRQADRHRRAHSGRRGRGPELFDVSDVSKLRVYVNMPQSYVPRVAPGTPARITVSEHPEKTYAATVESSSQAVVAASGTTLMQLAVDNSARELMPGGYASVQLQLPRDASTLNVPASALIFDAQGLRAATVSDSTAASPRDSMWRGRRISLMKPAPRWRRHRMQRALSEHAIAALIGEDASRFTLEPRQVSLTLPHVPPGLPSTLLQRRPDVAAAQRRMQAANANIGVARAAYFPDVTLSGTFGFESDQRSGWIQAPNRYWSFGPNAVLTVFDAGRHKAEVAQARAQFDETAANYRSVALGAFQQIEDNLALIGRYHIADEAERSAVASAQQALDYSMTRYQAGAVNYLDVVVAQTAALQSRIEALDITTRQLRASVQLVRALGGGWQGRAAVASN